MNLAIRPHLNKQINLLNQHFAYANDSKRHKDQVQLILTYALSHKYLCTSGALWSQLLSFPGGVRISQNKQLCYVNTIDWTKIMRQEGAHLVLESNMVDSRSCAQFWPLVKGPKSLSLSQRGRERSERERGLQSPGTKYRGSDGLCGLRCGWISPRAVDGLACCVGGERGQRGLAGFMGGWLRAARPLIFVRYCVSLDPI